MYYTRPARGITENWRLGRANVNEYFLSASSFTNELGEWKEPQDDFHWPAESHPADWEHYQMITVAVKKTPYKTLGTDL